MTWWSQHGLIISIVNIQCGLPRSNCTVSSRSCDHRLLFNVKHTGQIDQSASYIEFEHNFPPQVYLVNAKSSLSVEGQHHDNIFFWECRCLMSLGMNRTIVDCSTPQGASLIIPPDSQLVTPCSSSPIYRYRLFSIRTELYQYLGKPCWKTFVSENFSFELNLFCCCKPS